MKNAIQHSMKYVVLSLLYVTNVAAQSTKTASSLLWKISGNGLKEESYILLTTTNLCKDTPLNGKILSALGKVKYVCYEQGSKDPLKKAAFQKLAMVSDEKQSIKNHVSRGVYEKLTDRAMEGGLDEGFINSYKPMGLLSIIIKNTIVECNTASTKNYESLIREYATKKTLKQGELFGLEEFMNLYDAYDKTYWDKSITFLLDNDSKMLADLEMKETFYNQENFSGIKSVFNSNTFLNARFLYSDIEIKRMNLAANRVDALIKNQATLFVIDFNNVANTKTSLFTFLTNMGYELSAVNNNNL